MLGLVGEYLGRLYMTVGGQPQSAIREVVRPHDGSDSGPIGSAPKAKGNRAKQQHRVDPS